jgi:hypothetical protein
MEVARQGHAHLMRKAAAEQVEADAAAALGRAIGCGGRVLDGIRDRSWDEQVN